MAGESEEDLLKLLREIRVVLDDHSRQLKVLAQSFEELNRTMEARKKAVRRQLEMLHGQGSETKWLN